MSRRPNLVTNGYVNAGKEVKLRVLNVFSDVTTASIRSDAFVGASEKPYGMDIIDDTGSTTGKSAVVTVTVDTHATPGAYETEVAFPEWDIVQRRQLFVDEVTPTDPATFELIKVDDQGMYDLRISALSRNRADPADAATDIPPGPGGDPRKLDTWFGLVGDRTSGSAHQRIIVGKEANGTYTVKVREWFFADNGEYIHVVKTGHIDVKQHDVKPGQGSFVVNHRVDLAKLGDGKYVNHKVDFGDDHGQPDAKYGVTASLVAESATGGNPDENVDYDDAMHALASFRVLRREDHVIIRSRNAPYFKNNTNYKVKYVVTVVPTASGEGFSAGQIVSDTEAFL